MDAFNRGIYSPAQADQLVADAKDANANVLVVQVGRRCDCFCNDALYPRTDAFIDPAHPDAVDYVVNLDYIRYPDYNSATFQNDWATRRRRCGGSPRRPVAAMCPPPTTRSSASGGVTR